MCMSQPAGADHRQAADAFASRVREEYGEVVETVKLYGSVARDEARGVSSDVDLLVVLRDEVDRATDEDRIRAVAYEVELEYAVVLSLVVTTKPEYTRRADHPFFRQVRREATTLYG